MSVLRDIFSGTIWVVAARWSIRGIGLISTLVLARLLTPADFGVVAMSMFVVGLISVFGDTGLVLYIIRHPNPQRSHFDTVFTLRLLVGIAMSAAMLLVAPSAAVFFNEARVTDAIRVLALRPLMFGLENPGIIHFRRNMTFSKDFEFQVLNKVVAFFVTVALAFLLKNYWALVIGTVTGGLVSTIQSYRMHAYRPRFTLSETRAVWGYSFWILVQTMLNFLNSRVDELIIGRIKSTAMMGYYSLGSDLATSPVQEIVLPLSRALFPGLVRLNHDEAGLDATFGKVLSAVAIIALSVSTGIAMVAADVTQVVLGAKWAPVAPLMQILAISAGFMAMAQPLYTFMDASGRVRISATIGFVRLAMLVSAMIPAALWYDLWAVASARAAVAAVTFALTAQAYAHVLDIPVSSIWGRLLRPALAAIAMCAVVALVQFVSPDIAILRLGASMIAGAAAYAGVLLLLWQVAGKPDSVETELVALTTRLFRMLRR